MSVLLVTSCSSRKSVPIEDRLIAENLPDCDLNTVASTWRAWLKEHHCWKTARDMYNGRGFLEAKKATEVANAQLWIVSAGVGLVAADESIPAYDLTVARTGTNQIRNKIKNDWFSPQQWWHELSKRRKPKRTFKLLMETHPSATVVIALSTNYLEMIRDDLDHLDKKQKMRLRLIGPPQKAIPDFLKPVWLPYDDRLNGPESSMPGTRSDFPQRAARHFLESIWPLDKKANSEAHVRAIEKHLKSLPYPVIPKRKQMTDSEIINVIQALWTRAEGKSGLMLRLLRDERNIACEQGRFKHLFHQAKEQLETVE